MASVRSEQTASQNDITVLSSSYCRPDDIVQILVVDRNSELQFTTTTYDSVQIKEIFKLERDRVKICQNFFSKNRPKINKM